MSCNKFKLLLQHSVTLSIPTAVLVYLASIIFNVTRSIQSAVKTLTSITFSVNVKIDTDLLGKLYNIISQLQIYITIQ